MKQSYILVHDEARRRAGEAVGKAPHGYVVTVAEPTRNLDQSAKFHAICGDLAKSGLLWMGAQRTAAQWKVLLISGHAVATKEGADMIPGLEGEYVNIRESSALMSVRRSASLITYALAFCDLNGIKLSEPRELERA